MLGETTFDIGRDPRVQRAVTAADDVDVPPGRRERLVHELRVPFAFVRNVGAWRPAKERLRSLILGMIMTFTEIGVRPELVAALSKQRITEPTAIQIAALPVLLGGRDAYLNSETGTGKTLAYLLPIFSRLDLQREVTQVVVIAPTHELAIQIQRQCTDLAQNAGWPVRTLLLIGGTSTERQIDKLKKKPHVVVGSPGRIRELIAMRKLKTPAIGCVVIDEADRLLLEESLPDVRAIIQATPAGRQLVFASATEQPESAQAIATLAPDVVMLRTGAGPVNENIEHC
jgi:superfamily II DNA/RNA helicase